jgi:hypothetical protein
MAWWVRHAFIKPRGKKTTGKRKPVDGMLDVDSGESDHHLSTKSRASTQLF